MPHTLSQHYAASTAGLVRRAFSGALALAVAAVLSGLGSGAAQASTTRGFTDWTAASAVTDTASGSLRGVGVRLSGGDVHAGILDGTFTGFSSPSSFYPALANTDAISLGSQHPGHQYRITFDAPVKDPVLHLASLASELTFPAAVTKRSGALHVDGTRVWGTASGSGQNSDANGTIQLAGTYSTITFTAKPHSSAPNGDGFYLQIAELRPAFTNWTAASTTAETASGSLNGTGVKVAGGDVHAGILDGTFTGFASASWFSPALANADTVSLGSQNPGHQYRITFDAPVKDPVLHLASLASELTFPTAPTKRSGTLNVDGTRVWGAAGGSGQNSDANGTIQLTGTYSAITVTARPHGTAPHGDGFYLQIGTLFAS